MEQEIIKDIPWFNWKYQASNRWYILNKNWIMKEQTHHQWYKRISLILNWKKKTIKVHRLVAITFIPNPDNKKCVCHKDNNKSNNNISNLYWGTHSENTKQAFNDWLIVSGFMVYNPHAWKRWSSSWFAKKISQYDKLWNLIRKFDSIVDAEAECHIARQSISAVCRWVRKTAWWFVWKFIN